MPEHRFHTPEPAELEIKIPIGEIEVETVDGDESTITVEGSEKILELTEVRQEGRRLVVELKGKKPFGITISIGDLSWGGGGRLKVRAFFNLCGTQPGKLTRFQEWLAFHGPILTRLRVDGGLGRLFAGRLSGHRL